MKDLPNDTESQLLRLLEALTKGSVSTPHARELLDIPQPAPRIFELRAMGHKIVTRRETVRTDKGRPHRFGVYTLLAS